LCSSNYSISLDGYGVQNHPVCLLAFFFLFSKWRIIYYYSYRLSHWFWWLWVVGTLATSHLIFSFPLLCFLHSFPLSLPHYPGFSVHTLYYLLYVAWSMSILRGWFIGLFLPYCAHCALPRTTRLCEENMIMVDTNSFFSHVLILNAFLQARHYIPTKY